MGRLSSEMLARMKEAEALAESGKSPEWKGVMGFRPRKDRRAVEMLLVSDNPEQNPVHVVIEEPHVREIVQNLSLLTFKWDLDDHVAQQPTAFHA